MIQLKLYSNKNEIFTLRTGNCLHFFLTFTNALQRTDDNDQTIIKMI